MNVFLHMVFVKRAFQFLRNPLAQLVGLELRSHYEKVIFLGSTSNHLASVIAISSSHLALSV